MVRVRVRVRVKGRVRGRGRGRVRVRIRVRVTAAQAPVASAVTVRAKRGLTHAAVAQLGLLARVRGRALAQQPVEGEGSHASVP
jgi:hypothetical protein